MRKLQRWVTQHVSRSRTGLNSIERRPWFLG
jgi:hypothetical protein